MVKMAIGYEEMEREFSRSSEQVDALISDLSTAIRASTLRSGFKTLVITAFAQRLLYDDQDPILDMLDADSRLVDTICRIADTFEPPARAH